MRARANWPGSAPRHDPRGLCLVRPVRGARRIIVAADIMGADANNAGLWLELDAILAVVIGGTSLFGGRFSLVLAMVGALIIQAMNTGILLSGYPPEFNLVVKAAVVLIVLLLQSPRFAGCRGRAGEGHANEASAAGRDHGSCFRRRLSALCTVQFPNFASTRVLANLLTDNAFLGIVAAGMTFVIISGGIDLSVGSVIGFTAVFVALAIERLRMPPLSPSPLILAAVRRLWRGHGRIIHFFDMPPFIVTLAGMFLARGLCFLMSTESTPISAPLYSTVSDFALRLPGRRPAHRHRPHHARGGRGRRRAAAFHPLRGQRLCARRQPRDHRADGHAGRVDDGAHLHAVERPCRARRHRVLLLHCGGLLAVGRRRRTRFHRGRGDRRNLADRRAGVGGRHVARRADQGLIQTYINFDGTLSSWWTKIVTGCCCSFSSSCSAAWSAVCASFEIMNTREQIMDLDQRN